MSKGLLIIISGPSGVGKGTIIQKLLKSMPEIEFSVSATTRPPRENEVEGVHYFFITRSEFEKRIASGEFLEWAKVHDHYYGTPRSFVESKLKTGLDVVLDIDIQGGLQVRKTFPEGVFIFIVPPNFNELKARLEGRHTEKKEAIEKRLADAKEELKHLKEYDYLVPNDKLADATENIRAIIRAEKFRKSRNIEEISHDLSPD